MEALIAWVVAHALPIISGLLVASEVLALIPGIKSNSVFQLVVNALLKIKDALSGNLNK